MGKSKKKQCNNNSNSDTQYKISRKHLTDDEIRQYKLMGIPDLSQNWLELFNADMVNDLFTILRNNSNNPKKAKMVSKYMRYFGFEDVGLGTNVFVMSNPRYPGVVFKFALDDFGLADNYNDVILQDKVPKYARVLARHPSSIVTVQERKVVISSQERMDVFRADILKTLAKLSKDYLIVDLSPNNYLNYGIERNGDWCFIDASDLYPLKNIKDEIRCNKAVGWDEKHKKVKYCGGRFTYNQDFSGCICSRCEREILPLELRPEKNDKEELSKMANSYMDGFSFEKRSKLVQDEMAMVKDHHPEKKEPLPTKKDPKTIFVKPAEKKAPAPVTEEEEIKNVIFAHEEEDETTEAPMPEEAPAEENVNEAPDTPEEVTEPELKEALQQAAEEEEPEEEVEEEPSFQLQPRTEDDGIDEDSIPEEAFIEPEPETNEIEYKFVLSQDNEDMSGIFITVHGDFDKAWEKDGMPIFVSIGDTFQRAISFDALKQIIGGVVEDLLDEQAEFKSRQSSDDSDEEDEEESITK